MSASIAIPVLPDRPFERGLRQALFQRAFELAFFIHGRKAVAFEVALGAMGRLEVAAVAQERRRAYTPKGRLRSGEAGRPVRSRVLVEEAHLLQRLVYAGSEPFELWDERRGTVDEEDLLLRFVKHLVRVALKRNSFHVTLALGRLLHGYSTRETLDLYALVTQDGGRVPDEDYCRSRKKQLFGELRGRFGALLTVVPGLRGEQRFLTREDPGPLSGLVEECLRRFAPWDTACPVPERFEASSTELRELAFAGGDPDDEHPVEMRRIHALLDPRCFRRLAAALGLERPERALALPLFSAPSASGGGPRRPRRATPPLAEEEWELVEARLGDGAPRRGGPGRYFAVAADGRSVARLEPRSGAPATLELGPTAEVIEVSSSSGEALATCLRTVSRPGQVRRSRALLPDSGALVFELRTSSDEERIEVRIVHDAPRKEAAEGLEGLLVRFFQIFQGLARVPAPLWVALSAGLALNTVWNPLDPPRGPAHGPAAPPTAAATRATPLGQPAGAPSAPAPEATREVSRDLLPAGVSRRLSEVRVVLLVGFGHGAWELRLREALRARLRVVGRPLVTDEPDSADAALKGSVAAWPGDGGEPRLRVSLVLVNAEGQALWRHRADLVASQEALDGLAAEVVAGWGR